MPETEEVGVDRTGSTPDEDVEDVEPRHDTELDTGHPPWVKIVTLVVLALFLLVTLVSALA